MSEHCDMCGREYFDIYRVPDHVWEEFYESLFDRKPCGGGLLCLSCFKIRKDIYWEGAIGEYPTEQLRATIASQAAEIERLRGALEK